MIKRKRDDDKKRKRDDDKKRKKKKIWRNEYTLEGERVDNIPKQHRYIHEDYCFDIEKDLIPWFFQGKITNPYTRNILWENTEKFNLFIGKLKNTDLQINRKLLELIEISWTLYTHGDEFFYSITIDDKSIKRFIKFSEDYIFRIKHYKDLITNNEHFDLIEPPYSNIKIDRNIDNYTGFVFFLYRYRDNQPVLDSNYKFPILIVKDGLHKKLKDFIEYEYEFQIEKEKKEKKEKDKKEKEEKEKISREETQPLEDISEEETQPLEDISEEPLEDSHEIQSRED